MKGKQHFLFASLLGVLLLLMAACGSGVAGQSNSGQNGGQSSPSSGQTNSQQSNGPSIVGTWTGICSLSDGIEFKQAEFDADGTLVLDNYVAKYEVSGNQMRFIAPQATYQHSYSLSADGAILTLYDSSGGFCSIGRVGSNATQEAAQALIGAWAGQSCNDSMLNNAFSKIEFRSDGTAIYNGDSTFSEPYSVSDPGHIVFPNLRYLLDNSPDTWSFLVSGSTLTVMVKSLSGPATCSFQKSA